MRKLCVGAACAVFLAVAGSAQAGPGVEGAPEGRSIDLPSTAVIAGTTISVGEAADRDLSCLQLAVGPLQCQERSAAVNPSLPCFGGDFGDALEHCTDEAINEDPVDYGDTSAVDAPATAVTQTSAGVDAQRRLAEDAAASSRDACLGGQRDVCERSHDGCGRHMEVYEHNNYAGWQLILGSRGNWYNLVQGESNDYNDNMSSFRMGEHSGHFSEHNGGSGYWYPGATEVCSVATKMVNGWNDRISSRYRN